VMKLRLHAGDLHPDATPEHPAPSRRGSDRASNPVYGPG
jgi:hypothetical protein